MGHDTAVTQQLPPPHVSLDSLADAIVTKRHTVAVLAVLCLKTTCLLSVVHSSSSLITMKAPWGCVMVTSLSPCTCMHEPAVSPSACMSCRGQPSHYWTQGKPRPGETKYT